MEKEFEIKIANGEWETIAVSYVSTTRGGNGQLDGLKVLRLKTDNETIERMRNRQVFVRIEGYDVPFHGSCFRSGVDEVTIDAHITPIGS